MATLSIPRTSGIYKITCTANGRFYIGSSNNCNRRWMYHRRDLRGNRHHSLHMQRAWNKHGEGAFTFEIIECVMPWSLFDREQYWLDTLKSYDNSIGFNISSVAECPNHWTGRKHTPETRLKMSIAQMGHTLSPESRAKISAARKGTKRDPAITEKIASKLRGRKHSPESVERVAAANRGQKRSPEVCRKNGEMHSKAYILTSPDGIEFSVTNLKQFCRENHIGYTNLSKVANGNGVSFRGWKARHVDEE